MSQSEDRSYNEKILNGSTARLMKINFLIGNFLTNPVRLQTAPTGPGKNIKLPKYLFKLHQTSPTNLTAPTEIDTSLPTLQGCLGYR